MSPRIAVPAAWAPAAALFACLLVAAVAGAIGHRHLVRMADAQLAVAGRYAAHHFEAELLSRLRAVESAAATDAQIDDPTARREHRRAVIANLVRLYPEMLWAGFAERPGRVAVAHDGQLVGVDVSERDWWRAGLRGPHLGDVHDAEPLDPPRSARGPGGEAPRVLDVAVPLRRRGEEPYGVLAAHLDARWVLQVRDDLGTVTRELPEVDLLVLSDPVHTVGGQRVRLSGPPGGDGRRDVRVDDRPRVASVHAVDGDVVVSRLGWRAVVVRDPDAHALPARLFVAWAIAVGVVVGLGAAAGVGALQSWGASPTVRPRPVP